MLPKYAYYYIAALAGASLAAADCWTGNIHSPCNGAEYGCSDGFLVSG